jgi:hypothetical protein
MSEAVVDKRTWHDGMMDKRRDPTYLPAINPTETFLRTRVFAITDHCMIT